MSQLDPENGQDIFIFQKKSMRGSRIMAKLSVEFAVNTLFSYIEKVRSY